MDNASHYTVLLCSKLWSLRKEHFLCDTTIVTGDREIPAHSIVLAAGSSAFQAAFKGSSGDDAKYRIEIPHLDGDTIEAILSMIYNGQHQKGEMEEQNEIDEEFLKRICQQFGIFFTKDDCHGQTVLPSDDLEWMISGEVNAKNLLTAISNDMLQDEGHPEQVSTTNGCVSQHNRSNNSFSPQPVMNGCSYEHFKPLTCNICSKLFDGEAQLEVHSKLHIVDNVLKPHACDTCSKSFRSICELRKHCQIHSGLDNGFLEVLQQENLKRPVDCLDLASNQFVCDVCSITFNQMNDLIKHKEFHMTEKSPVHCDFEPFQTSNETIKLQSQCLNNTSVKCQLTGKSFKLESYTVEYLNSDEVACKHCQTIFLSESDLELHVAEHDQHHTHTCVECGKVFGSGNRLAKHLLSHKREDCYVCFICHQGFRQRFYLLKHLHCHSNNEPRFSCSHCGKSFKEKYSLRKHEVIHSSEKPFMCEICSREFRQKYYLKKHRKRHTDEYNYSCEYCGKSFKENYQLKKHCLIHTATADFPCGKCSRSFRNETLLQRHLSIHDDSTVYPCEVCGKTFRARASLNIHRKGHAGEAQFKCKLCGDAFMTVRELRRHEAVVHASLPPSIHQCYECGKLFSHSAHLKSHAKTHTDERPYACPLCQRTFRRQADMRSHILTHTGQKTNLCSVCGKGFLKKSDLKRHFQAHTDERPYVCDTCGKAFKVLSYLKEHLYTHAERKAFVCSECKKAFNSVGNLKNHLKIHSGMKPHKCHVCSKDFLRPANLRSHLKVHVKHLEPFSKPYSPLENLTELDTYTLSESLSIPSTE